MVLYNVAVSVVVIKRTLSHKKNRYIRQWLSVCVPQFF